MTLRSSEMVYVFFSTSVELSLFLAFPVLVLFRRFPALTGISSPVTFPILLTISRCSCLLFGASTIFSNIPTIPFVLEPQRWKYSIATKQLFLQCIIPTLLKPLETQKFCSNGSCTQRDDDKQR